VLQVLTDRETEYCGRDERHPYQIFISLDEIDHTWTKANCPQTNGICERFHQICVSEFYKIACQKKIYRGLDTLQ
jgi:transposase InsO family protein